MAELPLPTLTVPIMAEDLLQEAIAVWPDENGEIAISGIH
jgi:hypothetical protein